MVPIRKLYIRAVKMSIGTNNLGVETYGNKLEKHKEKEEKMCSTYVRLYVEIVAHFMSSFLQE